MSGLSQSRWAPAASDAKEETNVAGAKDKTPSINETDKKTSTTSTTLSGAAQTFAPVAEAPPPDTSTYDEFTRTGADQDDLFDDIIPESMQTRPQDDIFADEFTPAEQPVIEQVQEEPAAPQNTRGNERGRGRGRGRGGARPDRGNKNAVSHKTQSEEPAQEAQAPENAPTGPKKEITAAVRGDRFATGGVRKPKLSEAELAEKMAKISVKNATLTAAYARAEEDAANFAQREAQARVDATKRQEDAKVRAKEERKDRQQMMGERERNRQRKLKAMEGREWDAEKNEDDFTKGGRYDKKGVSGQEEYNDGREYLVRDAKFNAGRGGRQNKDSRPTEQRVPRKDDFPALSEVTKPGSGAEAVKSWADQVETSNAL